VGDDESPLHAQVIERRGDPVGLCRETVVGVLGATRAPHAEWLDDEGAIARRREKRDHLPVSERGSEQPGDQDYGRCGYGSRLGNLQRFGRRHG